MKPKLGIRKPEYKRYAVFMAGILVFTLVIFYSDIQKQDFFRAIDQVGVKNFFLLSFAYVIAWGISGWRWALLVHYFLPNKKFPKALYLYAVILGQFSAYVVFKQIASVGSKALCLGREVENGTEVGLISSVIEVTGTCLVLFLMAVVSLSALTIGSSTLVVWIASLIALTVLSLTGSNRYFIFFLRIQLFLKKLVQKWFSLKKGSEFSVPNSLPNQLTRKIFFSSLIIYLIALFRCVLILVVLDYKIDVLHFILLCPLVIFVSSLGITPGGFGVLELSWIGVFTYFGLTVEQGTIYALVKRVADDAILVTSFISAFVYYEIVRGMYERFQKKNDV